MISIIFVILFQYLSAHVIQKALDIEHYYFHTKDPSNGKTKEDFENKIDEIWAGFIAWKFVLICATILI